LVDIFLYIDVKSDKTVNQEEMEGFMKLLKEFDLSNKNKVAPGDIEAMPDKDFINKIEKLREEVDKHEFINKE
jgi:hypothetical protein